jgi:triosephosphate isomerase
MIFVNFKTYQLGTGERAVEMVRMMEKVSKETGVEVVPVVQGVDVYRVSKSSKIGVWCQHVDGIEMGAHTGWVLPEVVKEAGAVGVVLNHSERKFRMIDELRIRNYESGEDKEKFGLRKAVERCREVGLKTLVCADDLEEAKKVVEFKPDYLAYEPPGLIGSTEVSVVTRLGVVKEVVELAEKTPVIIGAGVHKVDDIRDGLKLNVKGFLIASAVMRAEDPEIKLRELSSGYGKTKELKN